MCREIGQFLPILIFRPILARILLYPKWTFSSFTNSRNKQTHRYHVQGACHREGMRPFFCPINYKLQFHTNIGTHHAKMNYSSFIKISNKQKHWYHVGGACHREGMRPFFCPINYKSQPRTYFGTHHVRSFIERHFVHKNRNRQTHVSCMGRMS